MLDDGPKVGTIELAGDVAMIANRILTFGAAMLGIGFAAALTSPAEAKSGIDESSPGTHWIRGPITKAQLAGAWTATIIGKTGCGWTTMFVQFTLNAAGTGNATRQMHSEGCGDFAQTDPIVIQSIGNRGVGNAGLSCGPGCGWQLKIQVDNSRISFPWST